MIIAPTGFHRFYVFEVNNLAERTMPGTGSSLTYSPNDKLYVSSRGLLTSEKESPLHVWTQYVVANTGTDFQGDFLYVVAAV